MKGMKFSRTTLSEYTGVGVFDYEAVYIYSDLRGLADDSLLAAGKDTFLGSFIDCLLQESKTVVIPAFTYTTEGIFNTATTNTRLGALNTYICRHQNSNRSEHPLFSYASIGSNSHEVTYRVGKSAFGCDSVIDRLRRLNTCFLHIGRPIHAGNTIAHYIEQGCGALYRYHKMFETSVFSGEDYVGSEYTAFLRVRNRVGDQYATDFRRAADILIDNNIARCANEDSNMSAVSCYGLDEAIKVWTREFYNDPRLFIDQSVTPVNLDL